MSRSRRSAVIVLGATLLITAGCGSDDETDGDGSVVASSTPVTAAPTVSEAATTSGAGTEGSAPAVTEGGPTTVPAEVPTTLGAPAPLVDPAVELFEIGQFDAPVEVVVKPLDERLFIIEQGGTVRAVDDESDEVVLDISDLVSYGGEQGLLGLAFHPTEERRVGKECTLCLLRLC